MLETEARIKTTETTLAAFTDPIVAEETGGSDYTPERLLAGPNTHHLVAPRGEQERLQTIFSTQLQSLWACVEMRSTQVEGPIDPALLIALDECANVAALPELDAHASTARGLGVQLVTAFHGISQMEARFGRPASTTITPSWSVAGSPMSRRSNTSRP